MKLYFFNKSKTRPFIGQIQAVVLFMNKQLMY